MTVTVRETNETSIRISLDPRGDGSARVETPYPFLTHMIETLARYAGWTLEVTAAGDLRPHVIEDVAITLGLALREVIPETCARYGDAFIPMDDALVHAAADIGGRPFYKGRLPGRLYEHFFRSLSDNAAMTLHITVHRGRDPHHIVEAAFKAVGVALAIALRPADRVFSTKGGVTVRHEEA